MNLSSLQSLSNTIEIILLQTKLTSHFTSEKPSLNSVNLQSKEKVGKYGGMALDVVSVGRITTHLAHALRKSLLQVRASLSICELCIKTPIFSLNISFNISRPISSVSSRGCISVVNACGFGTTSCYV